MADHDRKKTKEERAAEREAAKQLLLETNIQRVFSILAGFNLKQPLGEKKEELEKKLKTLSSMVDTERAAFGVLGPNEPPLRSRRRLRGARRSCGASRSSWLHYNAGSTRSTQRTSVQCSTSWVTTGPKTRRGASATHAPLRLTG